MGWCSNYARPNASARARGDAQLARAPTGCHMHAPRACVSNDCVWLLLKPAPYSAPGTQGPSLYTLWYRYGTRHAIVCGMIAHPAARGDLTREAPHAHIHRCVQH